MSSAKLAVGYQGIAYSNNHQAAQVLCHRAGLQHARLVPLITSANVAHALQNRDIDLGVMAISNSIGGEVAETKAALQQVKLHGIQTVELPIHHYAFKREGAIQNNQIKYVASHPQALKQCLHSIERIFPEADLQSVENTALAAQSLAQGKFNDHTAVICTLLAGEHYNLALVAADMEDSPDNRTVFGLYQLA